MQGRLSEPTEGFQETPKNWKREFGLLETLGLSHIDWVVTGKENPIFYEDLTTYNINSICADNLIDKKIFDFDFLTDTLEPLCKSAAKNKIPSITIPLLEESSVVDDDIRTEFIKSILRFVNKYPEIKFSFEAELHHNKLLQIVELRDNMFVTYDTGNTTSFGLDHQEYIRALSHKFDNVHIKDRTFSSETVAPLTGDTDFNLIFEVLFSVGYSGAYTLQAARGQASQETDTIRKYLQIFKEILDEKAI